MQLKDQTNHKCTHRCNLSQFSSNYTVNDIMQSDTIKNLNIRVELDYISFLSYTIWLINLSALDMVITCSYHVHQQPTHEVNACDSKVTYFHDWESIYRQRRQGHYFRTLLLHTQIICLINFCKPPNSSQLMLSNACDNMSLVCPYHSFCMPLYFIQ